MGSEFDRTYPSELNEIINESEFKDSIANINEKLSGNSQFIVGLAGAACFIAGVAMFLIGGLHAKHSSSSVELPLLIVFGCGVFIVGILIVVIGCWSVNSKKFDKIKETIDHESLKYANRTPISCRWRLDPMKTITGESVKTTYRVNQMIFRSLFEKKTICFSIRSSSIQFIRCNFINTKKKTFFSIIICTV